MTSRPSFAVCCAAVWLALGCQGTVDSLGSDAIPEPPLSPLKRPASYPNAFATLLGKTQAEIDLKIQQTFDLLFHGDPTTEAVYFPVGSDQALIRDILHDDVRTEGIGYAMMICVELDKRDEFDRLWRYADAVLRYASGPERGYFRSSCDTATGSEACLDPFGHEQIAMALIFAHDRWGSDSGIDYQHAAQRAIHVLRNKVRDNGGVVDGITDMVDADAHLFYDVPLTSAAGVSRPSIEMPAFYDLWSQATGDSFWTDAAASARTYLQTVDNPTTGLMPTRATFDGKPVAGSDTFAPEGYRTQLNMALDSIWSGQNWVIDENNRLLAFFFSQGMDTYGKSFTLDGTTVLDPLHEPSLIVMNGASALAATNASRTQFVDAVWNLAIPTGDVRYYTGILDLSVLILLSGQYRVW